MPSFSVTDRALAAAGSRPVASSTSHPSAALPSVSNCAAITSAAIRGRSAGVGRAAPCSSGRTGGPTGTTGTPTSASRSVRSSGAHVSTSAPSSRNRTASPTSGSTSPRPPYVDNNARILQIPSPQVLASTGDCAAPPPACRKRPLRYTAIRKFGSPHNIHVNSALRLFANQDRVALIT